MLLAQVCAKKFDLGRKIVAAYVIKIAALKLRLLLIRLGWKWVEEGLFASKLHWSS